MIYMIDAWLDCAHPKLRILEKETGKECLVLDEQALTSYREQGLLDSSVLYSTDQTIIQEMTEELLTISQLV